jgi:hypothetical protein
MSKLKVYVHSNIDGTHSGMVAAPNQKEAAKLFHCSVKDLRSEGYILNLRKMGDPVHFALTVVMKQPGIVFKKKIMTSQGWQVPWLDV